MQFVFFTGLVASEPESFDLFPPEDAKDGTDTSYCLFDVAVRRLPRRGEQKVDYFKVRAYNKKNTSKNGEVCQKYLRKGMKVIVVGELQPEQVETPDGELVMSLGVQGSAVEFGDKKKDVMQFVPDLIETFTDIPREDLIDW